MEFPDFEPGSGCPQPEGAHAAFITKVGLYAGRTLKHLDKTLATRHSRTTVTGFTSQRLLRTVFLHCPYVENDCQGINTCPLVRKETPAQDLGHDPAAETVIPDVDNS